MESKYHHQEASIVGTLVEVFGLSYTWLKEAKTVTVYDDEHACVEVQNL